MSGVINLNTIVVNGEPVAVTGKPTYKRGVPKVDVKTATVGDNVELYESLDYTEAMGEAKFKMQPTAINIEMLENWQDNVGKNSVRMIDTRDGLTKTFNKMSISEDVEVDGDTEIEVIFIGGQGV